MFPGFSTAFYIKKLEKISVARFLERFYKSEVPSRVTRRMTRRIIR